jgi:hypothetical protein
MGGRNMREPDVDPELAAELGGSGVPVRWDRLGDLVTDLEEVHGPVTDEELAAARAEWPQA